MPVFQRIDLLLSDAGSLVLVVSQDVVYLLANRIHPERERGLPVVVFDPVLALGQILHHVRAVVQRRCHQCGHAIR